ncbi:MAG: hypothetical protein NUW37_11755 [Planctomycetes bacterium]|nr:hypothetical protein [Planctomycetota bacterium]
MKFILRRYPVTNSISATVAILFAIVTLICSCETAKPGAQEPANGAAVETRLESAPASTVAAADEAVRSVMTDLTNKLAERGLRRVCIAAVSAPGGGAYTKLCSSISEGARRFVSSLSGFDLVLSNFEDQMYVQLEILGSSNEIFRDDATALAFGKAVSANAAIFIAYDAQSFQPGAEATISARAIDLERGVEIEAESSKFILDGEFASMHAASAEEENRIALENERYRIRVQVGIYAERVEDGRPRAIDLTARGASVRAGDRVNLRLRSFTNVRAYVVWEGTSGRFYPIYPKSAYAAYAPEIPKGNDWRYIPNTLNPEGDRIVIEGDSGTERLWLVCVSAGARSVGDDVESVLSSLERGEIPAGYERNLTSVFQSAMNLLTDDEKNSAMIRSAINCAVRGVRDPGAIVPASSDQPAVVRLDTSIAPGEFRAGILNIAGETVYFREYEGTTFMLRSWELTHD